MPPVSAGGPADGEEGSEADEAEYSPGRELSVLTAEESPEETSDETSDENSWETVPEMFHEISSSNPPDRSSERFSDTAVLSSPGVITG